MSLVTPGGTSPSGQQQPAQFRISENDLKDVTCPAKIVTDDEVSLIERTCGGTLFEEAVRLKMLSPLVSPDGQRHLVPIQALVCRSCGQELDPEAI